MSQITTKYLLYRKLQKVTSNLDVHTKEVVKKSFASMSVKVLGMIVGLLVSVFLGRILDVEGFGVVNLVNRIALLCLVFSMFGVDNVLVKNISIAYENGDKKEIASYILTSLILNGLLALILSSIGVLCAHFLAKEAFSNELLYIPLIITFFAIVPLSITKVFSAGLIGVRRIWQSNLMNETLGFLLVGFGILTYQVLHIGFTIISVTFLFTFSRFVTAIIAWSYWKRVFKYIGHISWRLKPMLKMASPLFFVSVTSIVAASADIIMLGWLSDVREVGLYGVAARLALLISFFLHVSNSTISPKLASLYAKGQILEMNLMVNRVTRFLLLIAIVFLLIFIFGGQLMLGLWGNEFVDAYSILIILGVGQFFNISTGCSGMLLIMCGFEKLHGFVSLFSVILNLVLNYFLIVNYGAVGAATATAITVGLENIIKVILAKRYVGVLTLPLNNLFKHEK